MTVAEALTAGVHVFGFPEVRKPEVDDNVEKMKGSVGDLNGVEFGNIDTKGLRSMQDTNFAAFRARGELGAGDTKTLEEAAGGKEDLKGFHEAMKDMADKKRKAVVDAATQGAEGEGESATVPTVGVVPRVGSVAPETDPEAQKRRLDESTTRHAMQQHDNIKPNPTAQPSTPPLQLLALRIKTRCATPNTKETITQLAREVDKHKLNLYQVNKINTKESMLTQTTLD